MRYRWRKEMARRIHIEDGRGPFNWKSPIPSSISTRSAARSSGSPRRPPAYRARKARSARQRPRNRAPVCLARRLRRDCAVSVQMGSTVAERLCREPRRPQRLLIRRRMRRRTPNAKSQRSETATACSLRKFEQIIC